MLKASGDTTLPKRSPREFQNTKERASSVPQRPKSGIPSLPVVQRGTSSGNQTGTSPSARMSTGRRGRVNPIFSSGPGATASLAAAGRATALTRSSGISTQSPPAAPITVKEPKQHLEALNFDMRAQEPPKRLDQSNSEEELKDQKTVTVRKYSAPVELTDFSKSQGEPNPKAKWESGTKIDELEAKPEPEPESNSWETESDSETESKAIVDIDPSKLLEIGSAVDSMLDELMLDMELPSESDEEKPAPATPRKDKEEKIEEKIEKVAEKERKRKSENESKTEKKEKKENKEEKREEKNEPEEKKEKRTPAQSPRTVTPSPIPPTIRLGGQPVGRNSWNMAKRKTEDGGEPSSRASIFRSRQTFSPRDVTNPEEVDIRTSMFRTRQAPLSGRDSHREREREPVMVTPPPLPPLPLVDTALLLEPGGVSVAETTPETTGTTTEESAQQEDSEHPGPTSNTSRTDYHAPEEGATEATEAEENDKKDESVISSRVSSFHPRPSSRKPMDLLKKTVGFGFAKKKTENTEPKYVFNEEEAQKSVAGFTEQISQIKATIEDYKQSLGVTKKPLVSTSSSSTTTLTNNTKTLGPEAAQKRAQIAKEIFHTESTYIKQLESLIEKYYEPMKQSTANLPDTSMAECLASIFGTIQKSIIPFNKPLLEELKNKVDTWTDDSTMGDVFVQFTPFMKMYTAYGDSYQGVNEKLHQISTQDWFIAVCPAVVHLESLLIAPIQRIPRYNLLLKDLLDNTSSTHPDHALLIKSLGLMGTVATHVNQSIANTKNYERVREEGVLFLMEAHRNLQMYDTFTVLCDKKKYNQRIMLFNDVLALIDPNSIKKKIKEPKDVEIWPLELVWLIKGREGISNVIDIKGPGKAITLSAVSDEMMEKWWPVLNEVIDKRIRDTQPNTDDIPDVGAAEKLLPRRGQITTGHKVYNGWWLCGRMHGVGRLTFHGAEFVGDFKSDSIEGIGCLKFVDGHVYFGNFVAGERCGVGELSRGKETYVGEWEQGQRTNLGEMRYCNGDKYLGNWKNNARNGVGKLTLQTSAYVGNWKQGLYDGEGTLIDERGVYEGGFANGRKEGNGIMKWKRDKSVYDGQWKVGRMHGIGTFINGMGTYEGEFSRGAKKGKGIMTFHDGSVYDGHWSDDRPHGTGVYENFTGYITRYDGEWAKGRKSGKASVKYSDGTTWEGTFVDDVMNGSHCKWIGPNWEVEGRWKNGMRDGKCNFSWENSGGSKTLLPLTPLELQQDIEPWEQTFMPNALPTPFWKGDWDKYQS